MSPSVREEVTSWEALTRGQAEEHRAATPGYRQAACAHCALVAVGAVAMFAKM